MSKKHFIPAFIMLGLSLVCVVSYTPMEYLELYQQGNLLFLYRSITIAGIFSNAIYLWLSFLQIRRYKNQEKSSLSFDQSMVNYLQYFLLFIVIFIGAWMINFVNASIFNQPIPFINYDSVWSCISLFIYVIGYFSLKQPELLRFQSNFNFGPPKARLSHH